MITRDEAIDIATKDIKGTYEPEELDRIEVELEDDQYIVKFVLIVPPDTLGSGFIQVTLDACCGRIVSRLRDAD